MSDNTVSVLFYVQHLLGVGHVFRATRVARAMSARGFRVHVVWGGTRLPSIDLGGLEMHWLEPVRAASSQFDSLLDGEGRPAGEAMLTARCERLLGLLEEVRPDIVMTETFPFGRRQMQFELLPFVEAAASADWRPMVVSSIRDMMTENRKEKRARESIEWARAWFDLVLVHGDPNLVRIEETLQHADEIAEKFRYTGIVAPEPVDLSVPPSIEADVVVSAGGGAVGHALTAAAIGADGLSRKFRDNWLLVVGPERAAEDYRALLAGAGEGMRVERYVPDLTRVMAAAKVSVSRAGYNTVGDVMRAGRPAVLVPYEGGRETEQARRARMFAERGYAVMLRDEELDARMLAAAVDRAADMPPPEFALDLEGAGNSARVVMEAYRAFRKTDGA